MDKFIKKILWTVSGAEIDILKKCRTDYNKFAAIGATILMTTFIAFCAGTSAAWFFTQSGDDKSGSIGWAMVFGVIWALLIFSIDRSLVITLKKDPSLKKQKFWVPLSSRSALACIIAFMVSIPLELVVFDDFIAEQKFFFDEISEKELSESTRAHREEQVLSKDIDLSTQTMERLDNLNDNLRENVSSLNGDIQSQRNKLDKPTTAAFTNAQRQYNELSNQISTVQKQLANATSSIDSSRYEQRIRTLRSERQSCYSAMQTEKRSWNESINKKIKELETERDITIKEIEHNSEEYSTESARLARSRDTRDSLATERGHIIQDFRRTSHKGNHFIQNFRILEYSVNKRDVNGNLPTEFYFLWLIRLLFFIIEILPTVVKIVTPIGSYDRMVDAEEKEIMKYLQSVEYQERIKNLHDIELKSHEEQLLKQGEMELELKNTILEKVKNAQLEVADLTITKWKEGEIAKVNPKSDEPAMS